MQYLFVYGSLRRGYPNEHVMNDIGGDWQEASIKGTWHSEGWGYINHGLKGLVVDADGEKISGFVFSSENLSNHWPALDKFEGDDYERVEVRALYSNGEYKDVFVYGLKRKQAG